MRNLDIVISITNAHTIVIDGDPVAKERPRRSRNGGVYTPANTRAWKETAQILASAQMRGMGRLEGPLYLSVTAIFAIPKSWPKWKREMAQEKKIAHTAKPDGDNVLKAVMDAFNGIVWHDDSQVAIHAMAKQYGATAAIVADVGKMENMLASNITKRPE